MTTHAAPLACMLVVLLTASAAVVRADASSSVAVGYGRGATGGGGGPVVVVSSTADQGPGTLREAASGPGPRTVVFDVTGTIVLQGPVQVASDTTIDGSRTPVTIAGGGLQMLGVDNVVVRHLSFANGVDGPNADMINIGKGSHDIWLDHLSLTGASDELVSIWGGSTDITVSWSRFHDADKALLVGTREGGDTDRAMRVTVHNNVFERLHQRTPRVTWGKVHAFNNLVVHWTGNAMSAVREGHLLSENNIFVPAGDLRAVRHEGVQRVDLPGLVRSTGDWLQNGATAPPRLPDDVFVPDYPYTPHPADHTLQTLLQTQTGAQTGPDTGAPGSPPADGGATSRPSAPDGTETPTGGPGDAEDSSPDWPLRAGATLALLAAAGALLNERRRDKRRPTRRTRD